MGRMMLTQCKGPTQSLTASSGMVGSSGFKRMHSFSTLTARADFPAAISDRASWYHKWNSSKANFMALSKHWRKKGWQTIIEWGDWIWTRRVRVWQFDVCVKAAVRKAQTSDSISYWPLLPRAMVSRSYTTEADCKLMIRSLLCSGILLRTASRLALKTHMQIHWSKRAPNKCVLTWGTNKFNYIYHGLADEQQQQRFLSVLLRTKEAEGKKKLERWMTQSPTGLKEQLNFGGCVLSSTFFPLCLPLVKVGTNINTHFSPEYTRGRRPRL